MDANTVLAIEGMIVLLAPGIITLGKKGLFVLITIILGTSMVISFREGRRK